MMRVDFYHLTRSGPDGIVPALTEKLVSSGGRLLIVADDQAALDALDTLLWTHKPESFLPHVIAGGDGNADADEVVLLSSDPNGPANDARAILLADGVWRDEALVYDRAFYLFDATSIDAARTAWKALGANDGLERHYWKQDDRGRWAEGP